MKIVIRTDSSLTLAGGHFSRCLALARRMRDDGASVMFLCRVLEGSLFRWIDEAGFPLHRLSLGDSLDTEDYTLTEEVLRAQGYVDWLIVDCYHLDLQWESPLCKYAGRIMVIDDIGDRDHDCDLLLDQNLHDNPEALYRDKIKNPACRKLFGPKYALLRPEFAIRRNKAKPRGGNIGRMLISLGSTDRHNLTEIVLEAAAFPQFAEVAFDIVLGPNNWGATRLQEKFGKRPNWKFHAPAPDMAALMCRADLAIGGAGITTWERCCLGLPTLFIAGSDNEIPLAKTAEKTGIGRYIGNYHSINPEIIADAIDDVSHHIDMMKAWSANAFDLVDGRGTERVCEAIYEYSPQEAAR
jgi:UDP-2,4-diacetamido-2,4,6-trideoxy-beta-L-altropyranose hydrolase